MGQAKHRRDKLLHAAKTLLHHYGPSKTTIADIAKEARVSVGSVYLEFSSKDAIIGALSDAQHARVLERIEAAITAATHPEAQLRAALRARLDGFLAAAACGRGAAELVHCSRCEAVNDSHSRFLAAERRLLMGILVEGSAAGIFIDRDPEIAAIAILRAHVYFSPPWIFQRPCDALRGEIDALHDLLFRGLLA